MEPTPAAPSKRSSAPMIISIVAAALLSLCCCCPGLMLFARLGKWETSGIIGEKSGNIPPLYGWICIGAAIIPWFIPLIIALARRSKT
jgi:hypothetical protein